MKKANNHGLSIKDLATIKKIIATTTNAVEKVALFGSRATGKYKPYSDIDIVLFGNITRDTDRELRFQFGESYLPYKVDINSYQNIDYPPLKQHIDENSKLLFSKQELYAG